MADENIQTKTAPYLPWTSFQNITDELRGKGIPPKLDRTAIQGKSGSTQAHYLAALRFLDMLDSDDRPTERFKQYVEANMEGRSVLMRTIVFEKYRAALDLGTTSTSAALSQVFRDSYNLEGETARKAIAFFVNAARFSEIEISQYWPQTRPRAAGQRRASTGAPRKRTTGRAKSGQEPSDGTLQTTSDPKNRYIDLLLKRAAESDGDLDTALLDRIERVLGIADAQPASAPASSQGSDPGGGDGD